MILLGSLLSYLFIYLFILASFTYKTDCSSFCVAKGKVWLHCGNKNSIISTCSTFLFVFFVLYHYSLFLLVVSSCLSYSRIRLVIWHIAIYYCKKERGELCSDTYGIIQSNNSPPLMFNPLNHMTLIQGVVKSYTTIENTS